jgi:hypothetical protein
MGRKSCFTTNIAGLRTQELNRLEAGSFYHPTPFPIGARPFCVVVRGATPSFGDLYLDGESKWSIWFARPGDPRETPVIYLPVGELLVSWEREISTPDYWEEGVLLVTPNDALFMARIPGHGRTFDRVFVSLATWQVTRDPPNPHAAFTQWKLLSRTAGQEDQVLIEGNLLRAA